MTKIHSIKNVVQYDFSHNDKRYNVSCVTYPQPWHESQKEHWIVRGGGARRDHYCEPTGATFKRVVAALKAEIARRDAEVFAQPVKVTFELPETAFV